MGRVDRRGEPTVLLHPGVAHGDHCTVIVSLLAVRSVLQSIQSASRERVVITNHVHSALLLYCEADIGRLHHSSLSAVSLTPHYNKLMPAP